MEKKTVYEKAIGDIIEVLDGYKLIEESGEVPEPDEDREPRIGDNVLTNKSYSKDGEFEASITKIKGKKFTIEFSDEDGGTDEVGRDDFELVDGEAHEQEEEVEEEIPEEEGYTQEDLDEMSDKEIAELAVENDLDEKPKFSRKNKKKLTNREAIEDEIIGGDEPTLVEPGTDDEGFGTEETSSEGPVVPPTIKEIESGKVKRAEIEKLFISLNIEVQKAEKMTDLKNQCMVCAILSTTAGNVDKILKNYKTKIIPKAVKDLAEKLGVKPDPKVSVTLEEIYNVLTE